MSNLNRKIRNMEDEMEQLTAKLRTTNEKLEDIAKAADECERFFMIIYLCIQQEPQGRFEQLNNGLHCCVQFLVIFTLKSPLYTKLYEQINCCL